MNNKQLPRFKTLCDQAKARIDAEMEGFRRQMAWIEDPANMVMQFYASGMSFRLKEDSMDSEYVKEILRDETGMTYKCYLENDVKDSTEKQKMLEAFGRDPYSSFQSFLEGYNYESEYLITVNG